MCNGQEWHNPSDSAAWVVDPTFETPFKSDPISPLLDLHGASGPRYVTLDYCHVFHLGYGIDMGASTICLLCRLDCFGTARAFDTRLGKAYEYFSTWCKEQQRVTSISDFNIDFFDMATFLDYINDSLAKHCRVNSWPTSLHGKAYDTAVILAWLEDAFCEGNMAGTVTSPDFWLQLLVVNS